MATARQPQPMNVIEFLQWQELLDERYELVDGVPVLMAGGSPAHALTAARILGILYDKLRGTGCVAVGSDLILVIDETNGRFPDVGIYCDPRDIARADDLEWGGFHHPRVLFEVLSLTTEREDRGAKVPQYQSIDTLDTIVLVNLKERRFETHERLGPDRWEFIRHPHGADFQLRDPALLLTHTEVFQ